MSSMPDIQNATIDRGVMTALARISTWPYSGVKPQNSCCSSATSRPSLNGCPPRELPTGPEKLALWMHETRNGVSCTPWHHSPCSAGMLSRNSPSCTA